MKPSWDDLKFRITERLGDPWYGVATHGVVPVESFAPGRSDLRDSMPTRYGAIRDALRSLPVRPEASGFLDYGCGKGRACVVAASLGFRSVTGIELSEELAGTARRNLERMRWRRTRQFEIVVGDAGRYVVPDDIGVIYFFNPFVGDVLRDVAGQIQASLRRAPRELHVVYFNNGEFDALLKDTDWLRKRAQSTYYPRLSCGLYATP